MTIAVIDYGIGNVQSVVNACIRLGRAAARVTNGAALAELDASKIILPGVGAIGASLDRLRGSGFVEPLERLVLQRGIAFLGICVGMQMLAETCEEFGMHDGLGWIPGTVGRVASDGAPVRVPHVGWNTVASTRSDPVLDPVDGSDFYFTHSYAMRCDPAYIAATTDYGGKFVSAVRHRNVLGVQFHPEKSSHAGARLIEQFLLS